MNHIYRLVFNRALGVVQVVSELASASQGGRSATAHGLRRNPLALACAGLLGMASVFAAMPASAGDVTSAGDIALSGDIVEPGNVSYISTGGSIFQSDPANDSLTVAGNALFGASAYIDLTGAGNDFQGLVSLQGNAATINDANALQLSISTIINGLTVTSHGALDLGDALVGSSLTAHSNGGAITGGPLVVNGSSTFDAGAGAVTLTNDNNDFKGVVTATGNGIAITDSTDLTTGLLTATGAGGITLDAGGALVATDTISTAGGAVSLTAAGSVTTSTIDAGTGNVTVRSTGGPVTTGATTGGNINLSGAGDVLLQSNVTAAGTLDLRSTDGTILQPGGAITVSGTASITAAGSITLNGLNDFGGTVNLTGGTVQINDANSLLLGQVSATDFTATASNIALSQGITTSGDQTYNGAVSLSPIGPGPIVLGSTGGGDISFDSSINGVIALTVNTSGTTTFGGDVGDFAQLDSLVTDAGGSTVLNGNVTTDHAQTYNDAATLGADITLLSWQGGNIGFGSTLDGAHALTVNTTGTTIFGTVGGTTALASLTTDAGGGTILNGNVTTTGSQNYNDTVTLGADATLASTGSGNIAFGSTVDGAHALTVNTGGNTSFGAAVGATTALTSLTTNAGGSTTLGGGVRTTGAQTYGDAVTLGVDATLASTGGGDITFSQAVDGAHALTVNSGGNTRFLWTVGGTTALTSLTTDAGGNTLLAGNVTTTGAQTYNDQVVITGLNRILTSTGGGDIHFGSNVQGALGPLTVHTGGAVSFAGTVNLSALNVIGGSGITQSGAFTITGTSSFNAGGNDITLTNAGNDFTGAVSLTGNNVQVTDQNDLTISALANGSGGDVSLIAGGVLTLPGAIATTGDITLASNGGALTTAGSLSGNDVSLTGRDGVTLMHDITATGTLNLASSGGNISQTAGALTADTLAGSSAGTTILDNLNQIATLGDFSANGFSLTDVQALTITGALSASGDITLSDAAGITVTGSVSAGGSTTLTTGTSMTIGNGGTSGSINGNVVDNGALAFNHSDDVTFAAAISGNGLLSQVGSGTLALDGDSSIFAGSTSVDSGTLLVGSVAGNGADLGGNVAVVSGATLGGHGAIGGNVDIAGSAHLAPGNSIGTLTIGGDLTLAQDAQLVYEFGAPGANFSTSGNGDSVVVGGNLTLNGAVLNITDAGGMGPGLYTLFSYGGTLTETNGGIVFGVTPTGSMLSIQNLTGNRRINLLDTGGMTLNFWNGNGVASATQMGGGDGSWSTTSTNWTDATGSLSAAMQPQPGFAIFGGAAGTVTIDNGSGAVAATGLQFASDGYVLDGDALTLVADGGASPTIRVGDGSAAGSGMSATIDSVLAGSDGLTKSDLGTLVLTADNTFSGTLGIDGGTLSVTREANLGDAGNVLALDGGVLRITGTTFQSTTRDVSLGANDGGFDIADAGNVFTLSQSLSGSGAFAKSGAGSLVFTGDNTYTGGTIISAGTLQIGNGGTSGSITGDVANNGTLAFDRSDAVTFAGAISGTGTLQQVGSGTTILTGVSTYTGGTGIDAGTLQIGNGGTSGSIAGNVTDNGTLAFDRSDALTFAGTISGTGSLQQIGSGTLVLDGDNSAFAGATSVQSGSLIVGGTAGNGAALGGDVDVASGAMLGGHGEIGGSVTNAGTLAPGASIGTLTIHGDYTQAATGTFEVEVTPDGQADLLAVDGSATLAGGTVVVAIDGDWKPRTDYTILTAAGGVNGSFDAVSSNLVFLDAILGYGANAVTLSLQRNDVAFSSFAGTRNQRATAAAADTLAWGNAAHDALTMIDAAGAPQAFDALSGEVHATTRGALLDDSRHLRDAVDQHLQGVGDDAHAGGWIANWGHWARSDSDGNADALRADGLGFAIGADRGFGARARLGVVAGSSQITVRADARASVADVDSRHLGAYGRLDAGWLQLRAGAARSWQQVGSQRAVVFAGYDDTLQADYDARTTQAYLDGSHAFAIGRGSVAPFLNLAQVRVRSNAFNETGGDAALQVEAASDERTYATLGMRWSAAMGADEGLRLQGSVGWTHASGGSDDEVNRQRFLGGSDMFEIAGTPIAENAFSLDAGLRWQADPHVVIEASYVGRFASDARDQGARLMLNWAF